MNKKILSLCLLLLIVFLIYKILPCILPGRVCPKYKHTFRIITYDRKGIPTTKLLFMRNLKEYLLLSLSDGTRYRSISTYNLLTDKKTESGSSVGSGTPFVNLKNNNTIHKKKDEVDKYVYTYDYDLRYMLGGTRYFQNNEFVVNIQILEPYKKYRIAKYDSDKNNDLFYELAIPDPECPWRPQISILDEKNRSFIRFLCIRSDESSINYRTFDTYYYFDLSNFNYLGEKPEDYLENAIFSSLFDEYRPAGANLFFNKEKITTQPGQKDIFTYDDIVISQINKMKYSTELDPTSYNDYSVEVKEADKVLFNNKTRNNSLDQFAFSEDMKNLYLRYGNGDLYIVHLSK